MHMGTVMCTSQHAANTAHWLRCRMPVVQSQRPSSCIAAAVRADLVLEQVHLCKLVVMVAYAVQGSLCCAHRQEAPSLRHC